MNHTLNKKLNLNKKTIANLSKKELKDLKGGSFLILSCGCSESCSLIYHCCPTTEPPPELKIADNND